MGQFTLLHITIYLLVLLDIHYYSLCVIIITHYYCQGL